MLLCKCTEKSLHRDITLAIVTNRPTVRLFPLNRVTYIFLTNIRSTSIIVFYGFLI